MISYGRRHRRYQDQVLTNQAQQHIERLVSHEQVEFILGLTKMGLIL